VSLALFYLFAVVAVAGALGMVLNVRNTVAAALSLVATMLALGAIYVLLEAYLIGVLQILVYAGAIVVLFLFVVMLLNLRRDEFAPGRLRATKVVAVLLGAAALVWAIGWLPRGAVPARPLPDGFGGYRAVGAQLFTDYVLVFEFTSLLLLAAMVGAVMLAKRRID
jgi:NADH-quinone oxidoreductase subunit J